MSDSALDLGKLLIDELGLATSCDTLARWLVHHVAGMIKAAESAAPDDKAAAEAEARSGILELLTHIQVLPEPARKLTSEQQIAEALARLSPEVVETDGYFAAFNPNLDGSETNDELLAYLRAASVHDQLSRRFIRLCLRAAAQLALDREVDWISAVDKISDWDHSSIRIIRMVAYGTEEKTEEEKALEAAEMREERRAATLKDIAHVRMVCDAIEEQIRIESGDGNGQR